MTKNRYYTKLAEAKVQKVELGELQDLEQLVKEVKSLHDKAVKAASKADGEANQITALTKRFEDRKADMLNMKKDAVGIKKNATKNVMEMRDAMSKLESKAARAGQIINNMKVVEKELGVNVPVLKSADASLEKNYTSAFGYVSEVEDRSQKAFAHDSDIFR